MMITAETPVRDIAVEYPTAIPVLERYGIDYCCGGKHTLAEACAQKDLPLAIVLEAVQRQQQDTSLPETDWQQAPLQEIAEYIVRRHHAFTRDQLQLIGGLMAKVESRHGAQNDIVAAISKIFAGLRAELTHHFVCEETILFPYIGSLDAVQPSALPPVFGSVEQPITRMMTEHAQAGEELRELRALTNNYTLSPTACPTWSALYRAMEDLELDLHQHIHLENNILFPRALARVGKRVPVQV